MKNKRFAVYAPWPRPLWNASEPTYHVVDHGDSDISKYHAGDYWDSPNDPPPTRSEREYHDNFLGWTDRPESQWSDHEREMWQTMGMSYLQRNAAERNARRTAAGPAGVKLPSR